MYPTAIRATGSGTAASVGRLGGIVGPFLTPVLVAAYGQGAVFALFMVILVVTALNVFLPGRGDAGPIAGGTRRGEGRDRLLSG